MWVPSSGSTTDKPMAIGIGITDPTSKTSSEAGSDRVSLIAAKMFHEKKMSLFEQQVRQSERPIVFDKVPLIFLEHWSNGEGDSKVVGVSIENGEKEVRRKERKSEQTTPGLGAHVVR